MFLTTLHFYQWKDLIFLRLKKLDSPITSVERKLVDFVLNDSTITSDEKKLSMSAEHFVDLTGISPTATALCSIIATFRCFYTHVNGVFTTPHYSQPPDPTKLKLHLPKQPGGHIFPNVTGLRVTPPVSTTPSVALKKEPKFQQLNFAMGPTNAISSCFPVHEFHATLKAQNSFQHYRTTTSVLIYKSTWRT